VFCRCGGCPHGPGGCPGRVDAPFPHGQVCVPASCREPPPFLRQIASQVLQLLQLSMLAGPACCNACRPLRPAFQIRLELAHRRPVRLLVSIHVSCDPRRTYRTDRGHL
jgi:hypothetical protein